MRQGKVSDLIHSSETYPDLQFARVAVHFQKVLDQPNGDYEVVPGSEFTVTREARKDNTSKYWINSPDINRKGGDKVSNFKEVTTYLQQHGIDLDTTASSSSRARSTNRHDDPSSRETLVPAPSPLSSTAHLPRSPPPLPSLPSPTKHSPRPTRTASSSTSRTSSARTNWSI